MPRRGTTKRKKKTAKADPIFRNRLVNMLINCILKHGKKSLAYKILYQAMKKIRQIIETNPLFVLRQALCRVTTTIGVKKNGKKKGLTQQVPIEIRSPQGKSTCHSLVIRGIPKTPRSKYGFQIKFRMSGSL